jgi:hypothetical protein
VHRFAANNTAECVSVEQHSRWVICVTVRGLTGLVQWVGDMCGSEGFDMFGTVDGADRSINISERHKIF